VKNRYANIVFTFFFLGALVSCSSGPMSAEDLAAREMESDATLWDDEDYKPIAASSCLKYKVVFNNALGVWYADWTRLFTEYTRVGLTSGALDDDPKWGPIAETIDEAKYNALNRSIGGSGTPISTDTSLQAFELCGELGVDLSS
jgi:hypothetical protein